MKRAAVALIAIGICAMLEPVNATTQHFTSATSLEFLQGQVEITKESSERLAAFVDVIKTKCHSEVEKRIFLSAPFDERAGASLIAATTRVANAKAELQRLGLPQARFFENVEPAIESGTNGVAPPRSEQAAASAVLVEVVCHPK